MLLQDKLENIQYLLRIPQRKPWGSMADNVRVTLGLAQSKSRMMESVPKDSTDDVLALVAELNTRLERVQFSVDRQDADRTSQAVARALATVAEIELIQVCLQCFSKPVVNSEFPPSIGTPTC